MHRKGTLVVTPKTKLSRPTSSLGDLKNSCVHPDKWLMLRMSELKMSYRGQFTLSTNSLTEQNFSLRDCCVVLAFRAPWPITPNWCVPHSLVKAQTSFLEKEVKVFFEPPMWRPKKLKTIKYTFFSPFSKGTTKP